MQTPAQNADAARALQEAASQLAQDAARGTAGDIRVRAEALRDQANAMRDLRRAQSSLQQQQFDGANMERARQQKMEFAAFVIVVIAAVAIFRPLVRGYARRVEGRAAPANALSDGETKDAILRMEHAIDAMAIEIERISEGQRFTTKLLAERDVVR